MALAKNYSLTRTDFGTLTATRSTRGLNLNGMQVEIIRASKLTGDTTGTLALSGVQRPNKVYVVPVTNSAGTVLTSAPPTADVAFTHNSNTSINVSGLGNWTIADFYVCGRSY